MCESYHRKLKQPKSTPMPLVTIVRSSNCWRSERSRMAKMAILDRRSLCLVHDATRQREHVRTDPQMNSIRAIQIHVELQGFLLHCETHDSAGIEELSRFVDSKHTLAAHGLQHAAVSFLFRPAHKQNLAGLQFLLLANPADFDAPFADGSAERFFRQRGSEGKVTKDANQKGRVFRRQRGLRPFHKHGKLG